MSRHREHDCKRWRPAVAAFLTLALAGGAALAATTSVSPRWDLEFGSTAPDELISGTATVDTSSNKTVGGGAFDLGGTVRRGQFRIRGTANTAFSCSLPSSVTLSSGSNTATVDTFTTNPALAGTFNNFGRLNVDIGGTLQIPASQAAGSYAGTLDLTCDGITDSINVLATIGAFLSISNTVALEFGLVAPTASAGTVTVSSAGVRSGLNVTLLSSAPAAASFSLSGEPNQTYTVSVIPASTLTGPGPAMTLNNYTASLGTLPAAGTLDGTGSGSFTIGGDLSVANSATQTAGSYSGTFNVTISYN